MSTLNFKDHEFRCRCSCRQMLFTQTAIEKLQELRSNFGSPMKISSGYRCPRHNADVSSTGRTGPHTVFDNDNITVDVLVHTEDAHRLLNLAFGHGFTGIGISQKGEWDKRFLHLDLLAMDVGRMRPTLWSY